MKPKTQKCQQMVWQVRTAWGPKPKSRRIWVVRGIILGALLLAVLSYVLWIERTLGSANVLIRNQTNAIVSSITLVIDDYECADAPRKAWKTRMPCFRPSASSFSSPAESWRRNAPADRREYQARHQLGGYAELRERIRARSGFGARFTGSVLGSNGAV